MYTTCKLCPSVGELANSPMEGRPCLNVKSKTGQVNVDFWSSTEIKSNCLSAALLHVNFHLLKNVTFRVPFSDVIEKAFLDLVRTSLTHDGNCHQGGFRREDIVFC